MADLHKTKHEIDIASIRSMVVGSDRLRPVFDALLASVATLEADRDRVQVATEALRGLLKAAEDEVGPKQGTLEKNAEFWAEQNPHDHVWGVQRHIALAKAVIVAREALVRLDGEPTPKVRRRHRSELPNGKTDPTYIGDGAEPA